MNKVRGTLGTHPLCLYGTMIYPGYVIPFCGVRRLHLLPEAFQRLASSVDRQGHREWWWCSLPELSAVFIRGLWAAEILVVSVIALA